MASVVRKPFAPLDGGRLQCLTSAKNRQNTILSSAVKRKASDSIIIEDLENVDPSYSSKRPKGSDGVFSAKGNLKKQIFMAPKLHPTQYRPALNTLPTMQSRTVLKPKAPSSKLNPDTARRSLPSFASSDYYVRGVGRGGILQTKRRTTTSSARREPSSKLAPAIPFSIDAALKGTLSAYASSSPASAPASSALILDESEMEASWFFSIHEDTPEQEITNLLQHSTCVLDISSDEESEQKARHAKAEGRDKENIPPANDASQTSRSRLEATDSMLVDKTRNPLSQLNAADFYEAGCDETSIVLVSCDDLEEDGSGDKLSRPVKSSAETVVTEPTSIPIADEPTAGSVDASVEELMACRGGPEAVVTVVKSIDGTCQNFDVWESGSSREENLSPAPPLLSEGGVSESN